MENEFQELRQDEAINILANAGVTRDEFDEAMRRPFASEDLLAPALKALGVDLGALKRNDISGFKHVRRICILCDQRFRCYRRLSDRNFADTYADFCPNSETFSKVADSGERALTPR
jgi:hypothetical protein